MCIQIQDKFLYGDEVYEIAPMFKVPPCKPLNKLIASLAGFRANESGGFFYSTACHRGNKCTFALDGDMLVLKELRTGGGVYENQNYFISHSGDIILKKGHLYGYRENWSPTYYSKVIKLTFEKGILVGIKDISEGNQKKRERREAEWERKRIEEERLHVEKENNPTIDN